MSRMVGTAHPTKLRMLSLMMSLVLSLQTVGSPTSLIEVERILKVPNARTIITSLRRESLDGNSVLVVADQNSAQVVSLPLGERIEPLREVKFPAPMVQPAIDLKAGRMIDLRPLQDNITCYDLAGTVAWTTTGGMVRPDAESDMLLILTRTSLVCMNWSGEKLWFHEMPQGHVVQHVTIITTQQQGADQRLVNLLGYSGPAKAAVFEQLTLQGKLLKSAVLSEHVQVMEPAGDGFLGVIGFKRVVSLNADATVAADVATLPFPCQELSIVECKSGDAKYAVLAAGRASAQTSQLLFLDVKLSVIESLACNRTSAFCDVGRGNQQELLLGTGVASIRAIRLR